MKFLFPVGVLLALITVTVKAADHHATRRMHAARHLKRIPLRRRNNAANAKRCKLRPSTTASNNPASNNALSFPVNDNPPASGLINVKSTCGPIGATKEITATSGPNGDIDWLDCGVEVGGWRPPFVRVSDLITVDLSNAIKDPNGAFQACSKFITIFEKYGAQYSIPPIMMASFAMQESSCDPSTVGGAGEQGLMQLTRDKCGDAPGGNCKDPDYNIKTGTHYFSETLNDNNGNALLSIGAYNGWYQGMTYGAATAAAHSSCCRCQQNLDYLHQYVNGWLQNHNSYAGKPVLGKYFNLNVC